MVASSVRSATEEDMPQIRDLLGRVSTCPDKLDWRRFVVAVGPDGAIIGCGQLRRHFDGTRELASVATASRVAGRAWREQSSSAF